MTPVTDPDLLAQLDGAPPTTRPTLKRVTDPALLDQLEPSAQDRAQAAASGVNRGVFANVAGLPVATALNVWDLAKAGAGGVMGAFGAKAEDLPEMSDREKFVGSPEWIAKQFEQHGAGKVINPNRPDDTASRYAHAAGQGAAGALVAPSTLPQALTTGAIGAGTMLANEFAGEQGVGPAGQALISTVLPLATATAATRAQASIPARRLAAEQNAVRDAAIREAQDAGYVFPPSQINPTLGNKILGGISGKAPTEQALSLKNQPLTNALVRSELGLPENTPLSYETLAALRRDAGTHYDAVKSHPGLIKADDGYLNDLTDLHTRYQERIGAGSGQPALESLRLPAVEGLLNDMVKQQFTPTSAVELIKRFRSDADSSFRTGNTEAAHYQKGIANALEKLITRDPTIAPELMANFKAARQRIAQSYDVQDALNPASGNVDARKLAASQRDERPLSGGLLTAAKAGGNVPFATREYQQTPPGLSALDAGIALGGGGIAAAMGAAGTGGFAAIPALLPAARWAARAAVTSRPYQQRFAQPPTGEPSLLARSLAGLDAPPEAVLPLAALLANVVRQRQQ